MESLSSSTSSLKSSGDFSTVSSNGSGIKAINLKEIEINYQFKDFDDDIRNEINELYSYSELGLLKKSNITTLFYQDLFEYTSKTKWLDLNEIEKIDYLQHLIQYFELSIKGADNFNRYLIKSRFIWYIAQGVKEESSDIQHQLNNSKNNCTLLRKANYLPILTKTLLLASKISNEQQQQLQQQNDNTTTTTTTTTTNSDKPHISHKRNNNHLKNINGPKNTTGTGSLSNSLMKVNVKRVDPLMAVLLDIIYLFILNNKDEPTFKEELFEPLDGCYTYNLNNSLNDNLNELNSFDNPNLISIMIQLLIEFNEVDGNLYPIKKILMVLWRSLTVFIGGFEFLEKEKEARLKKANFKKGTSKTRTTDISNFIKSTSRYHSQQKSSILHKVNTHYLGTSKEYKDHDVFRLPTSLSDSLNVLQTNLYPPEQIRKEIGINYYSSNNNNTTTPHTESDFFYDPNNKPKPRILIENPSNFERFYCLNASNFSKIVIILLKILLASTPVVKNYTGPINLIAEIVIDQPTPGSSASLYETMQSATDFFRHKEIISKSTLGILLLIVKHSKFNQHLQFEYITKIMYESNALVLLYKCLNHEAVEKYLYSQNYLQSEEYFNIEQNQTSSNNNNSSDSNLQENYRNFFSTICSLKLIQKVMKHHPSRISSLSPSKSANILKKYCIVNQQLIKLYSLKIMKNLVPFQTKKWKQINMRIISDIYLYVPIHINDTWLLNHNYDPPQTDEYEVLLQEKVEEYHRVNYEQWYKTENLDLVYKNEQVMGCNIDQDFLNTIELSKEERDAIQNDRLRYTEGSSIIFINDSLEDELLAKNIN
ncbi:hypothetical protein DICPUDRAFT_155024 [Dictyostelium purpureum]|uniref:Far11/STRP C-terminal domain-containing protein n=1 Tax=Dictyostelium purpureum TaxID=5786 RepID=F0ZSV7_DICPU|nr:uncharacterized protein DICPUDRAFT_155024 [Dictyostelium purpureum]EGC32988.1 hypothetical protein DICPUDRAFT_155024 [Dictyostelium purpureum]|eukprot:XP_003290506.1 hypothetical protein DICPUDRAFT_155024 [Dictyostelium purpureum]